MIWVRCGLFSILLASCLETPGRSTDPSGQPGGPGDSAGPPAVVVYLDDRKVTAKAASGSIIATGVAGQDDGRVLQKALDLLIEGRVKGTVLLRNGEYHIGDGPIITAGGITLQGETRLGTRLLQNPRPTFPADRTFQFVANKHQTIASGGDDGIVLRDLSFIGYSRRAPPNWLSYSPGIFLEGAFNTIIENVYAEETTLFRFWPARDATAAQKQSKAGLNYHNLVRGCLAVNGGISNEIVGALDLHVEDTTFLNSGDDAVLVAHFAQDVFFDRCTFDGSTSQHKDTGGSNGQIFCGVDGTDPNLYDPRRIRIDIRSCRFRSNTQDNGNRAGIAGNQGCTLRVYDSVVEDQPGTLAPTNYLAEGGAIVSLGILTVRNTVIRNNKGNGIVWKPKRLDLSGAAMLEDARIEGNQIYDNNRDQTAGYGGLLLSTILNAEGAAVPLRAVVTGNTFFDDSPAPTQKVGALLGLGWPLKNPFLYFDANHFDRQPGSKIEVLGVADGTHGLASMKGNTGAP